VRAMQPQAIPRQGRRRPATRLYAAIAGFVTAVQTCADAGQKQVPAQSREHRPGHHGQVPTTHNEHAAGIGLGSTIQAPAAHNERRHGQRQGATVKYLRRTTSGAAGNDLGATIYYFRGTAINGLHNTAKYLRGAVGMGMGTTITYLRCTASAAASSGLGTTTINHMNQNAGAGYNWAKAHYSKLGQ